MRNKLGIFCMALGAVLIFGALSLFLYNQKEDQAAGEAAALLMPQIMERIETNVAEQQTLPAEGPAEQPILPAKPEILLEPEKQEMVKIEIDGHEYIGYLTIPALGLELPVMADWSYANLKIAPCRYYGSVFDDNLVIMAHNYVRHFKSLAKLAEGDRVTFTDMQGNVIQYEVGARDVLPATAIDEMTAGSAALTLFTCTYSGQERVTVYCDRINDN